VASKDHGHLIGWCHTLAVVCSLPSFCFFTFGVVVMQTRCLQANPRVVSVCLVAPNLSPTGVLCFVGALCLSVAHPALVGLVAH
jgi:hypothetical protein